MATVTFRGMQPTDLQKAMKATLGKRIQAALILLQNEMKIGCSEHSNRLGTHEPGESAGGYPYKITGRLAASISRVFDKATMTGRVGSNVLYSKFLQLGTRYMAARPFVTLAFNACREGMQKLINGENGGT